MTPHPFHLLQAVAQVTEPSPPSVGPWIAAIVGMLTIIAGAFKVGGISQRITGFENTVVKKLDEFISATQSWRENWSGWRATTDSRLGRVEQDQAAATESRHDLRNIVTEQISDHETRISSLEGERRKGLPDRRDP